MKRYARQDWIWLIIAIEAPKPSTDDTHAIGRAKLRKRQIDLIWLTKQVEPATKINKNFLNPADRSWATEYPPDWSAPLVIPSEPSVRSFFNEVEAGPHCVLPSPPGILNLNRLAKPVFFVIYGYYMEFVLHIT